MADAEIISERAIGMNELRIELEKIKKRDKELNFRAVRTEEYLQHFTDIKHPEELSKKLHDLNIPRLKEQHIVKILDILPKTVEDLKHVIKAYPVTINNNNLKRIADIITEFTAKK